MPAPTTAVTVAATGHGVFQDIIVPHNDLTVGGVLDTLRERGIEYNGGEVTMYLDGRPATVDDAVQDGSSLVIVPDKPTGN